MAEGIVEFISKDRYGLKIQGLEHWMNAREEKVKTAFKLVNKGDKVEYSEDDKHNLTFVRKIASAEPQKPVSKGGNGADFKSGTEVKPQINLDETMRDCLEKMSAMANDKAIKFPEGFDWTKIVITLFISKTKGGKFEQY